MKRTDSRRPIITKEAMQDAWKVETGDDEAAQVGYQGNGGVGESATAGRRVGAAWAAGDGSEVEGGQASGRGWHSGLGIGDGVR